MEGTFESIKNLADDLWIITFYDGKIAAITGDGFRHLCFVNEPEGKTIEYEVNESGTITYFKELDEDGEHIEYNSKNCNCEFCEEVKRKGDTV